jgi:peptidoglycan/LPS O-acetylase OafA/YrhL
MFPLMTRRPGNFDLMRLLAASMVFWSHQFPIAGLAEPSIPTVGSLGGLAVFVFFAISGYLNSKSILRSRSSTEFLVSRAFRIFPALVVCMVFCVVLGAFVTTLPLSEYIFPHELGFSGRAAPFSFLWRNSTLFFGLDYSLPGVFQSSLTAKAMAGPIWTLPEEAKLYIFLAITAFCLRFNARFLGSLIVIGIGGFAISGIWYDLTPAWLSHRGLTCAILFASGAGVAIVESCSNKTASIACFGIISLLLFGCGQIETMVLVAIAPACVLLNDVPLPSWTAPRLDISFGVYLYAFPIQQLTAGLLPEFWANGLFAFALTLIAGALSALLVEQPMLNVRKRLKAPANSHQLATARVTSVAG